MSKYRALNKRSKQPVKIQRFNDTNPRVYELHVPTLDFHSSSCIDSKTPTTHRTALSPPRIFIMKPSLLIYLCSLLAISKGASNPPFEISNSTSINGTTSVTGTKPLHWITKEVWDVLKGMYINSNLPDPGDNVPVSVSAADSIINPTAHETQDIAVEVVPNTSPSMEMPEDTTISISNSTIANVTTSLEQLQKRDSPFENMPLPDFDPFGDLDEGNSTIHSDASNTRKFYEFTEHNILESRAAEWYGEWSKLRSSSADWGPSAKGEWRLFVDEFTGNPNLECNLGVACQNLMSLASLVKVFPRNPELVRRIYFIENLMSDWHDFNSLTDQGYERVTLLVNQNLQSLISRVITRADPKKAAFCKLAHALVSLGVAVASCAAGGAISGAVQPYMQEGFPLAGLMQKFGKEIFKPKNGKDFLNRQNMLDRKYKLDVPGEGEYMSFNFNNLWQGILTSQLWGTEGWVNNVLPMDPIYGTGLEGGKGNDPMCSAFEGDIQVNLDGNVKKLQGVLGDEFKTLHKQLGKTYRDLFHGEYARPGSLSPTAVMFINQKWSGQKSVATKIENTDDFEAYFEMMMSMRLMSVMASTSHQYQKCTHDPEAQSKCAAAAAQSEPCKNPIAGKTKNCKRAVFCPRPDSDPTLICKAGAWYYAVAHGHETELPHLESWETMFTNRDDEVFKWNRNKMLMSTFNFYELYHNQFDSLPAAFGLNERDFTDGMIGLQIPVCNSMQGDVENGLFPVGCGSDWRASETTAFMDRMGMGEGSQVYNDRDLGFPNHLYVSTIPDALDRQYPQSVSPVSHFVTMCQLKIRHPDNSIDKLFKHNGRPGEDLPHMHSTHMEANSACGLVLDKTAGMDMDTADEWFCGVGAKEHKVFEREIYWTIAKPLLRTCGSHETRCKKWRKNRR